MGGGIRGGEGMKKPNHTPGPWKADGYMVRQDGSSGSRMIADICYTGPHHTPESEYPRSCRIVDEANARLIAAAPEMLEALEAADQSLADDGYFTDDHARQIVLRAITKAKGKA